LSIVDLVIDDLLIKSTITKIDNHQIDNR